MQTERRTIVISPPSRFFFNFKELWQYRELFYFFAWRDIKVKYKQTYLGVIWVIMQPLLLMLLFTMVFKKLNVTTGNIQYEIYVLSGLLFWTFFNSSVSSASNSIIDHSNIIKKVYFPRLIIPGATLLVAFFELLMMLAIFFVFCIIYQQSIAWEAILFFPVSFLLVFFAAFGISVFLSALSVQYRDFRYLIPFLLQVFFFSSGIVYSISDIDQEWIRSLLSINPLNAAIELFRAPFSNSLNTGIVFSGVGATLFFLFAGLYYFKKTEAYFADLS